VYEKRMDARRGLAVFRMVAATAAEWEEHFRDLDEVATWSGRLGFRAAVMVLPGPNFELPEARRRAELATKTSQPGYDPFVAIVQPNGVARGMLTMLQWMRRGIADDHAALSTEREALSWLEKRRGEPLPELANLLAEKR
jgi:hypothetical protein